MAWASTTITRTLLRSQHGRGLILEGLKVLQRAQFPRTPIHTGTMVLAVGAQTAPPNRALAPHPPTCWQTTFMGNVGSTLANDGISLVLTSAPPPTHTPCGVGSHSPPTLPLCSGGSPPPARTREARGCRPPLPHRPRVRPQHSPLPPATGPLHRPGHSWHVVGGVSQPGKGLRRPRSKGSEGLQAQGSATCATGGACPRPPRAAHP